MQNNAVLREALKRRIISLKDAQALVDATEDIEIKAMLLDYCNSADEK